MAITTIAQLQTALATQKMLDWHCTNGGTTVAGTFTNIAKIYTNTYGNHANPATYSANGTIHTAAESGFPNLGKAPTGQKKYLAGATVFSTSPATIYLCDRVWSCSGFDATLFTNQSIPSFPALPRHTTGEGLELWLEIYTGIGSTVSTITITYTNSDGVGGRTTSIANPGSSLAAGRMVAIPLQAGDSGVRSVQTVALSTSTGTAGNFGLTLIKRLACYSATVSGMDFGYDFEELGMPDVADEAALMLLQMSTGNTTGQAHSQFIFVEG